MSAKTSKNWYCTCPGHIEDMDPAVRASRGLTAVGAKNKWWPTGSVLKVGFMGGSQSAQTAVKTNCVKWSESANLQFTFPSTGPYDIRIMFQSGGGAWSYVGVDCKLLSQNSPTMNLGWQTPDVIWHEFGHTIGLLHEQQNPEGGICFDEAAVIAALSGPPNNWSLAQIRFNVLDKEQPANVITSPWDPLSIMHYSIPAAWTCNKVAIPGGKVISAADKAFIAARYPGVIIPPDPVNITLTPTQAQELRHGALNVQQATNTANEAAKAHRAKIQAYLGQ